MLMSLGATVIAIDIDRAPAMPPQPFDRAPPPLGVTERAVRDGPDLEEDDRHLPAVQRAVGLPHEEAPERLPHG